MYNKEEIKVNMSDMDYPNYLRYIQSKGYSREQINIDETYYDIVTRTSLAKGAAGTVIDVRCPSRYKMIIIGKSQIPEEVDFEPHSIVIRLANSDNVEIAPDARIRIVKEKVSQAITLVDTMFYKDINPTEYLKTPPDKTRTDKRYIFDKGIVIGGDEHLRIEVIYPDMGIDCENVKLSLDVDLLEKE